MINKKEFKKYMKAIKDSLNQTEKFEKAIAPFFEGYSGIFTVGDDAAYVAIDLLQIITDCKEGDWINYFIYECYWGKDLKIVEIDSKKFELKTIDDLWNVICLTKSSG